MRSIIQKVRIFLRSLTIFDLLIILAIVAVATVFLILRFSRKQEWVPARIMVSNDEWWWEGQAPSYWYVDDIVSGMTATNSFGETIAKITSVSVFDNGAYGRRAYVDVMLNTNYDKRKNVFLFNFQPLQIGKPIELTFGTHNIQGLVTYIGNDKVAYEDKKIEVKVYKVRPWVVDKYVVGLQMKDTVGTALATINEVKIDPHVEYEFSDIRGTSVPVNDPDYRDVTLSLTIKTFSSGGNNFFMDRAVIKIGEYVWFQFPEVAVREAMISKIIE